MSVQPMFYDIGDQQKDGCMPFVPFTSDCQGHAARKPPLCSHLKNTVHVTNTEGKCNYSKFCNLIGVTDMCAHERLARETSEYVASE